MRRIFKILFFLILLFFFFFQKKIFAKDYRVDYLVEYFLEEKEEKIQSLVSFKISITNLRSDIYVQSFSLSFPVNFSIKDVTAKDDWSEIVPQLTSDNQITKIFLKFSNPNIGKDTVNNLYLRFFQDNLFKVNGNVWEVIIPTIEKGEDESYQIVVNLPKDTDKKISIAKPIPNLVTGNKIFWQNPKEKTIYAVFGEEQYYKTTLYYHLENPRLIPVYTDIALPPDTLYQRIYLEKIEPRPVKVFQDDDGNFLARYILKPLEKNTIIFDGVIEVYAKPRLAIKEYINNKIKKQQRYLLTPTDLWRIDNFNQHDEWQSLAKPQDIYQFVVKKLKYNYSQVNKTRGRLGANLVLSYPDNAVCTEFTDLFIALAREKGVLSREVQGYGFTQDEKLRPLTLTSDILHAWPEYFDKEKELWIPIDPTWENTSGIDYFSSFDLNHITLVIHGKDPRYPVAAGMYKLEDSQDISIEPKKEKPTEKIKIAVANFNLPPKINDKDFYEIKLVIINEGNSYLWGIPVSFKSKLISFSKNDFLIDSLAPLEKKEISLKMNAGIRNQQKKATVEILVDNQKRLTQSIVIIPYYYELGLKISLIILVLGLVTVIFRLILKKNGKS